MNHKKEIFVFGSNTEGIHGAGAALTAAKKHGALSGVATGLQGNSYAIVTKNLKLGKRSISLEDINSQVSILKEFAKAHQELIFHVTPIGCGLAGYQPWEIGPLFKSSPKNMILPVTFHQYL